MEAFLRRWGEKAEGRERGQPALSRLWSPSLWMDTTHSCLCRVLGRGNFALPFGVPLADLIIKLTQDK